MALTFPEQFNMADYFLDHNLVEGRGDKIAVRYRDEQYTYADVQQMTNRCGNALRALGVEMEDRVLLALPDSIEFVASWFCTSTVTPRPEAAPGVTVPSEESRR